MKNNYPIKYALMPIIEQTGWTHGMHELEREYGVVCYIISKCYVIKETKKYNINGTSDIKYQVVFPYEYHEYSGWKREEPSFNLINNGCTNAVTVDKLYDSFEEAKKDKKEKNEEIHKSKYVYMRFEDLKEKINEINNEFNNMLEYYDQLEQLIKENTSDLEVNRKNKEQSIILYKNGFSSHKKYDESLYKLIDLFSLTDFIAYSLTEEEYLELQNTPYEDVDFQKYNHTPLLAHNRDEESTKVITNSSDQKYIFRDNITTDNDKQYVVPANFDAYFYTLENYEDIISSYKSKDKEAKVIKLTRKNNK